MKKLLWTIRDTDEKEFFFETLFCLFLNVNVVQIIAQVTCFNVDEARVNTARLLALSVKGTVGQLAALWPAARRRVTWAISFFKQVKSLDFLKFGLEFSGLGVNISTFFQNLQNLIPTEIAKATDRSR